MEPQSKPLFAPNINRTGRMIRGAMAVALLIGAAAAYEIHWLLTLILAIMGIFVLFESVRGWCVLRACRLRTPF